MKKLFILLTASLIIISCSNGKHAESEKNTEAAKAFFKLHEAEDAEGMFAYLHEDIQWHLPVYGMDMGGIEEVKTAILGYQAEFDNLKFSADYWLPGVDTETGVPDGSTRTYGTWTSIHTKTGKETKLTSYHSFEFKDGKIINGGDWLDLGGMMNSLVPQSLQKGNLLGLHVLKIKLNKGVTSKQFQDYWLNVTIPNYEKEYKGAKIYMADGLRGKETGSISMIWVFESEEARDAFYNTDGSSNELGQSIGNKLKPINDGLAKLGSWTSSYYTDWSVR